VDRTVNEMLRARLLALYQQRMTPTVDILDFLDVLLEEVIALRVKVAVMESGKYEV